MSDNAWAEIASFERVDDHYRKAWGADGWIMVSDSGMDELVAQATVMEECRDALAALAPRLGVCAHGVDIGEAIEAGDLKWDVNDYAEFAHNHRRTELALMLWGWHDDMDGRPFCIPWGYNPLGVLYPW